MNTSTLIGSAEACELLGRISRSTLTRWVKDGRIATAGQLSTGAFLFLRSDVEALARKTPAA